MGMYTGVRCKVIIKEEYRGEIDKLINDKEDWDELSCDFMKKYGEYSRADFIPYGSLSYMPDEWEDKNEEATEGFNRQFNTKSGYLSFQCSLKNYDSTIEEFFEKVLGKITETIIHLEKFYEECDYSQSYKLENNQIVLDSVEFIRYYKEY